METITIVLNIAIIINFLITASALLVASLDDNVDVNILKCVFWGFVSALLGLLLSLIYV